MSKKIKEAPESDSDSDKEAPNVITNSNNKEEGEDAEEEEHEFALPDLKRFDIAKLKKDLFMLVVGKRRYGKSTYAYNQIAKFYEYFPNGGYCFT
jgi:hypothetical protein